MIGKPPEDSLESGSSVYIRDRYLSDRQLWNFRYLNNRSRQCKGLGKSRGGGNCWEVVTDVSGRLWECWAITVRPCLLFLLFVCNSH